MSLKGFYFSGLFVHNLVSIILATIMETAKGQYLVHANALATLIDGVIGFIYGNITTNSIEGHGSSFFFLSQICSYFLVLIFICLAKSN